MELIVIFALVLVVVGILFGALIRAGLKLDKSRRQDLADRINAGRG